MFLLHLCSKRIHSVPFENNYFPPFPDFSILNNRVRVYYFFKALIRNYFIILQMSNQSHLRLLGETE